MTALEAKIVSAWRDAASDLGIRFTSPFRVHHGGNVFDCLGFVHQFGRRAGTVISVMNEPSSLTRYPLDDDYYFSELSDSYSHYDRQRFVDTLDDWQFFGPDSEKPDWYTGKSWGHFKR